ncbi:hypothetical protein L596_007811 [Steinernema carpocapsae]|uniref:Uncharacterized protein n=1 Tax=Steinernema carpocapsae TaxID=34508 RepID=A0A4V6A679_STECR|nr:hypothetical protein L596_007811 [Steinernema carpocapsae]
MTESEKNKNEFIGKRRKRRRERKTEIRRLKPLRWLRLNHSKENRSGENIPYLTVDGRIKKIKDDSKADVDGTARQFACGRIH